MTFNEESYFSHIYLDNELLIVTAISPYYSIKNKSLIEMSKNPYFCFGKHKLSKSVV